MLFKSDRVIRYIWCIITTLYTISWCFLHARGGVSTTDAGTHSHTIVFSTHVEVFLKRRVPVGWRTSFLHARGGVSFIRTITTTGNKFSPRTWRCFYGLVRRRSIGAVFSTHVEVFLVRVTNIASFPCFLHARGGVSTTHSVKRNITAFSPRTWRCFRTMSFRLSVRLVFSTHVEVFPDSRVDSPHHSSFLHARGGVSGCPLRFPIPGWFSPRTWRCFRVYASVASTTSVFSTHVEVFPADAPE